MDLTIYALVMLTYMNLLYAFAVRTRQYVPKTNPAMTIRLMEINLVFQISVGMIPPVIRTCRYNFRYSFMNIFRSTSPFDSLKQ